MHEFNKYHLWGKRELIVGLIGILLIKKECNIDMGSEEKLINEIILGYSNDPVIKDFSDIWTARVSYVLSLLEGWLLYLELKEVG